MQTKNIRGPARRGCVREQNRMGKIKTPEEIREEFFERYPALESCRGEFDAMYEACVRAYESGGKVLVAGNGGSAADAEHIVGELMKSFLVRRPADAALCAALQEKFGEEGARIAGNLEGALAAVPLTSMPALSTAFLNDVDPLLVFAQMLSGYGRKGDVFIGITTSGNSKNILNAFMVAKAMGITAVALTGEGGGSSLSLADICVRVPEMETFKVQEYHLPVYHALCAMLEARFFGDRALAR